MQATAVAHPNVALIKYWGKADTAANQPATGSLSLTLGGLQTRTTVAFDSGLAADSFTINGVPDSRGAARVSACLDLLRRQAGRQERARVESVNDFPTGAGLASSASGFAALVTAAASALGLSTAADELADIARLGSGSAPRSLYDGIVLLEPVTPGPGVRCDSLAAPADWPLSVIVAVTSRAHKRIGSTDGMEHTRHTSPYYAAWLATHAADLAAGVACIQQRDFAQLAELAEHSCLKMHAVAMAARPALVYWEAATLACMHRVLELRAGGTPVFFTIDAGPQVKAVCLPEAAATVAAALREVSGVIEVLESGLGAGARCI